MSSMRVNEGAGPSASPLLDPSGLTSSRGRVVKPRQWDDGTETAPPSGVAGPGGSGGAGRSKLPRRRDENSESEQDDQQPRQRKRRANYAISLAKRGSVPIRDETGRFIGVRPKTAAERAMKQPLGSGGIFKSAAVEVLRQEKRLMSTGDIAKLALKRGLIKCQGKTPEATMASALYTDVKRKESNSVFIRPHEGLFGLREWADKGLVFKDPMEDEDGPILLDEFGQPVVQDVLHGHGYEEEYDEEGGFEGQGYEASDGDIYGSEGEYEGYDGVDYYGRAPRVQAQPLRRRQEAEQATPAQTAPLRPQAKESPTPSIAAAAAKAKKAAADKEGSDDENSNIMLLLNAADQLGKDDGPEPSTAGTRAPGDAAMDDAHYAPGVRAARRAGPAAKGQQETTKFSRPHPLQAASGNDKALLRLIRSKKPRTTNMPHHKSYPSSPEEDTTIDLTIYGHSATSVGALEEGEAGATLDSEAVNILNLPVPEVEDTVEGAQGGPDEVPADADPATLEAVDVSKPAGRTAQAAQGPPAGHGRDAGGDDRSDTTHQPTEDGWLAGTDVVHRERLQALEANVLLLESSLGATHPQVGKAWLFLSQLYKTNPSPASQQMAEAALVRSWEIYALCQKANTPEELPPTFVSSFSYLLDKISAPNSAAAAAEAAFEKFAAAEAVAQAAEAVAAAAACVAPGSAQPGEVTAEHHFQSQTGESGAAGVAAPEYQPHQHVTSAQSLQKQQSGTLQPQQPIAMDFS